MGKRAAAEVRGREHRGTWRRRGRRVAAVVVAALAASSAAVAAPWPGSGYDLRQRGLSQSHYYACLQFQGTDGLPRPCPEIVKAIDFTADPYTLGLASPGFIAAFERRWGKPDPAKVPPDSGAFRRKKWSFLDNERGGLARAALAWACLHRPDLLGITAGDWTCEPTEREQMDFKAAYDLALLRAYFDSEVPGAHAESPQVVAVPGKPCSYAEPDPWWYGWTLYYHNTACAGGEASPGSGGAPGPSTGGPAPADPSRATLDELRRRLRELVDWLDRQVPPPGGSTGRVSLQLVPPR